MVRTITCAPNIECDDRNNDMMRFFQYLFNVHDDDDDACNCRACVQFMRDYNRDEMRARIERATRTNEMRRVQHEWISSRDYRNMNGRTR